MSHRRLIPPYRPGAEPSEERVDYLAELVVEKILGRSRNLKQGIKDVFKKHDTDKSGLLELR